MRETLRGRQRRQPVGLALAPATFDGDILALDVAGLLQTIAKCGYKKSHAIG
jgi:hypothetical protein